MLMQAHTLALCTSIPQHRGCSISMAARLSGAWCGRRPRCVSLPFVLRVATSDSVSSQKWRPGQTLSQAEMPYCSLRPRSTTRPRPAYLNATFIRHGEAQHHLQLSQEGERRLVESLRAARLRLFDTPTADILRRLFGERRLVNGAPHRRRSSVEGGSIADEQMAPRLSRRTGAHDCRYERRRAGPAKRNF